MRLPCHILVKPEDVALVLLVSSNTPSGSVKARDRPHPLQDGS